jgi:2-(1,2-epoxy-1,2-dihydrophenyl)acetyl-CoA isomerase
MTDIAVETDASGVATIAMCDPTGRNAFDGPLRAALTDAFTTLFADATVRAIVIGARAGNFSVGGNLATLAEYRAGQDGYRTMQSAHELPALLAHAPKPIVAAVTGYCMGAGSGLALLCDTIVVGHATAIGFPFVKLGLVPDFGSSHTLARRIGPAPAAQALMRARTFKAVEAFEIGLADTLVEDDAVWPQAVEMAGELAAMPAQALAQLRGMLRRDAGDLVRALETEALNQAICFGSPDLAAQIAAFQNRGKRA